MTESEERAAIERAAIEVIVALDLRLCTPVQRIDVERVLERLVSDTRDRSHGSFW
jgi:hypothetical protein